MRKILGGMLAAIFICSGLILGQGGQINSTALRGTSTVVVAGASVRVCTEAASGTPCSPLASIYTDRALTNLDADSVIAADSQGDFNFYAAPGCYKVQISATGFTTKTQTLCADITVGSDTTLRDISARKLNNIRFADQFAAGSSTGGIQEAVNDLLSGGAIKGKVVLAPGVTYTVTTPILIGNGSQPIVIELEGLNYAISPNVASASVFINNTSATGDTFVITPQVGVSSSVVLRGLQIVHPASSTGRAIRVATNSIGGLELDHVATRNAGVGLKIDAGSVNVALKHSQFFASTTAGFEVAGTNNLVSLQDVVFQSGLANGILIDAGGNLANPHFDKVLFESNASHDILSHGTISQANFENIWWETPGGDFLRFDLGSVRGLTCDNCHFDGSSGVGGRNVFNNVAADADNSIYGEEIVLIGGEIGNLNGGFVTKATVDPPSGSARPGFFNLTFLGVKASPTTFSIGGVHRSVTQPGKMVLFLVSDFKETDLTNSTVPYLVALGNDFKTNSNFISPALISSTANPASAGAVRLASADLLNFRNNANTADVPLGKDTSDRLTFDGKVIPTVTYSTVSASTNASIGATTMATAGASGNTYKFSSYVTQTAAGVGCTGNTTITLQVIFTDPGGAGTSTWTTLGENLSGTGSTVYTIAAGGNGAAGNPTGAALPIVFRAKTATIVQYSTTYTLGAGCTTGPSYQVYPILERLD